MSWISWGNINQTCSPCISDEEVFFPSIYWSFFLREKVDWKQTACRTLPLHRGTAWQANWADWIKIENFAWNASEHKWKRDFHTRTFSKFNWWSLKMKWNEIVSSSQSDDWQCQQRIKFKFHFFLFLCQHLERNFWVIGKGEVK